MGTKQYGDIISSDLEPDLKNSWGTDPVVFRALDNEFNFSIDAAADYSNTKCAMYFTKEQDALTQDWSYWLDKADSKNRAVFINPPYGRGFIEKFMNKCVEEKAKGVTSVMLVPATLDAQWLPVQDISEIRIITGGRLSFYHPVTNTKINGNTKGSMFVIFRPSDMPCFVRLISRQDLLKAGTEKRILKDEAA